MRQNTSETLKFSSLQKKFAKQFLLQYSIDLNQLSTIYFYTDGQLFRTFLPEGFSNFFYDLVAKNRYKLFGKKETCRIPTQAELSRFIA